MDLIDRQVAIDAVLSIGHIAKLADGDAVIRMSAVNYVLRNLPSAEPVRMKGKWIIRETENDRYDDMICPFCRTCYTVDAYRIDDIGFTAEDFNFCPNCGAGTR